MTDTITYDRMRSGHPANAQERSAGRSALRSASEWVLPTSPAEAGAMALFGPFGKAAKLGGLGAMLGGYGTDADAGSGSLMSLFSRFNPEVRKVLTEAQEFGKQFPGATEDGQGDAARHAYAAARLAATKSPEYARRMGALYELLSLGDDRRASRMDNHNNEVGAMLAEYPLEMQQELIRKLLQGSEQGYPQLQWSQRPYEAGL